MSNSQEQEVKDWLRNNRPVIRDRLDYINEICAKLSATQIQDPPNQPFRILTDRDIELIDNACVKKTVAERWDCISQTLVRKSNLLTIPFLIDIFEKTDNQHVIRAIADRVAASQNTARAANAQVPQPQTQASAPTSQSIVIQKEKFDSSSINQNLLDQIKGSYPMAEGSKGYALIINNINFDYYKEKQGDLDRTLGAGKDSVILDWVLSEKYGYLVQPYTNLNLQDMVQKIDDFKKIIGSVGNPKPHSIIVCIMSHGEQGDLVITTEKKEEKVLLYHAIDEFNNVNCPGLQDVPKIFLFQCCRGKDAGEAVQPIFQDDAKSFPPPDDSRLKLRDMLPTWSDMLLCYATIGRCKSYRIEEGSLFIQTFCDILQEYSNTLDISEIMTLVALRVKEYDIPGKEVDKNFGHGTERTINVKQICTFENILFKKKFYFPKKLS